MTITNHYLTHNRPYTKRAKTTAIAVHWVGNPGTSAINNRNYFQTTDRSVSSNYIVGLQGEVICCIPDEEMSWCTNAANSYTVSIETCHPDWTGAFGSRTYASLVELTAQLCKKYSLNPQKGGSDTADGAHWQQFLRDVANAIGIGNAAASKPASTTTLRYDWKQGQAVRLYKTKTQLFSNETATKAAGTLPAGTYYIYDGKQCKLGRFRVTTRKEYCGKTPAGKYVTGYVSVDNFREI